MDQNEIEAKLLAKAAEHAALTSAQRQAKYRKSLKEKGLVTVTVFAPRTAVSEMMLLSQRLCVDPGLEIAVRNAKTGRFERL